MFSDAGIYFQNVVCPHIGVCNLYRKLNGACAYEQKRMRSPLSFIKEIILHADILEEKRNCAYKHKI